MSKSLSYPCEALIDQNRYIGEDPIGHCCTQPATKAYNGHALCASCYDLIQSEPERVHLTPPHAPLEVRIVEWQQLVRNFVLAGRADRPSDLS